MPIYEIFCENCGYTGEVLVLDSSSALICPACSGPNTKKLMSATSSLTGSNPQAYPGPLDTACCGSRPEEAGCAGPGSCCGKTQ